MSNKFLDAIYLKKYYGVNFQNDWKDFMMSLGMKRSKEAIKIMIYPGVMGVAYYRVFNPFMELAKDPGFDIRISNVLSSQDDINWADIIYFERCVDRNIINESRRAKQMGKKIIFDTDDYMHGLPMHHPNKRDIENGRYLQDMDELCELANVITVSTDYLKKLYEERYDTKIVTLPNCVCQEDYDCAPKAKFSNGINIGWPGSATHFEDLQIVREPLIELFERYKDLKLITVNYSGIEKLPFKDAFEGIPWERRINIGGTEPHMIPGLINLIDIGIAPLLMNEFNSAKSNCKFLEFAMLKIPMVATYLEPYLADKDHCDLVSNNKMEWFHALEDLVKDAEERRDMGEEAQAWVKREYDIKKKISIWKELIRGLV